MTAADLIVDGRPSVPAHFDAETYGALRRLFRRGLFSRERLDVMTARLAELAVERVGLPGLLGQAHELADRLSPPDAFYVALARIQGAELLTCDARLAETAAAFGAVRLVS